MILFVLFGVLFLAVHAAVGLGLRIRKIEDMRQLLLDGGDAARVLAVDHIGDLFRKLQGPLFRNLIVADNVDRDVVIDVAQNVEIDVVQTALDLNDVLASHLVASCVLDNRYLTV